MNTRMASLVLLVSSLVAGCGTTSVAANAVRHQPLGVQHTASVSAATPAYATESAVQAAASVTLEPGAPTEPRPSDLQIRALEAASPDRVIENAPAEPGMTTESWLPWPKPPAGDLGNFGKVNDTLFRGARPTDKGLEQLVGMGVKVIVNFENDKAAVDHEQAWCASHGVVFHSIALSIITPPKQEKIDEFLKYAEDSTRGPLYFHCMQGRDRTGTAAFCYRIHHDHYTFKQAYAEMKSFNFHTYLLGLQWYIRHYATAQHAG
jgi:hypothetical protein